MKYKLHDIIERLESIRGQKLTTDEERSVEFWHKGQQLRFTVSTEGWKIATDILQSYVVKALEELASLDPAKAEEVQAQHAVVFVSNRLLEIFKQDVQRMINSTLEKPPIIKETIDSQVPFEQPL